MERVRKAGGEILFWNQDQRDRNFPAMEATFPTETVKAGGHVHPLPAGRSIEAALGGATAVAARLADQNMAGLIVLKDGRVVLERYARTLTRTGRWTSFSVAKSFTSTLVGAAIRDGFIKSVDDPVTRYLPELAGSGYDCVTVRQILTMTSGVKWNEDYTDPNSDVARMYAKPVPAGVDATTAYLRTLPREAAPGTKWVYKTGETNLIGVLVSRATGKSLAAYLSEKVWKPYGMERDAYWLVDAGGQDIGGCCFSVSLRDYARFGQFILEGGHGVLAPDWLPAATGPTIPTEMRGGYYGYQWWTARDHFDAMGIFGQSIHIDPKRRLVIVINSAWPSARNPAFEAKRDALIADIERATS
ncbi:MAG: beta-lactamase family protein [Sphingomonadaceae bacterium]|nr:beta-lactamase family protein [Sphingomonadaceae bacterium]